MADLFDDDDNDSSSEDFAKMFEASLGGSPAKPGKASQGIVGHSVKPGDRIRSEILTVGKEDIFVTTGTMDDGVVLRRELLDAEGKFNYKVGDEIDLFVTQVRGSQIFLSPKPTAKNMADDLEDAADMMLAVEGKVLEAVNGGFRVQLMGKTAFCPISQIDLRRVDDPASYIGKKFDFLITKFESRNIVVSRRKLLEQEKELSVDAFIQDHRVGDTITGMVTRMEKFGAFIEVAPGLEGMAHISEIAWSRLQTPNEALTLGQEVQAKILKIEDTGERITISLSIKQAQPAPWENLPEDIREGSVIEGRVTRLMKFGAFVELAPGIEGLVPLSEMSYAKRVLRADEILKEGERVSVLIKEVRADERRLLLSVKDAGGNPWDLIHQKFPVGAVVKGKVERREPYGLFVKLEDGLTGLLPRSKALENPEFPFEKVKVGEEVTVQVAEIRQEERRISLAIPKDPDADLWRGFAGGGGSSAKSLGTLGEQFKNLFAASGETSKSEATGTQKQKKK